MMMKTVNNCNSGIKNDFVCNFDKNYCDILRYKERSPRNEFNQNDINITSYTQGLSVSDDEALEDYLSALAKNYDDIDRRIKNAERFVDQIDSNESANCALRNGFKNISACENTIERPDEREIKYVTELRVNITDSLMTNISSNFRKNYTTKNNEKSLICLSSNDSIKLKNSPAIRKRTSLSKAVKSDEKTNSIISKNFNSCSINLNSDLEHVVIPPPKLFSSKYFQNDIDFLDKEVQTIDFNKCVYNIFAQSLLQDQAIQTTSANFSNKATIDTGMETEKRIFSEISKAKYFKEKNNQKSWSSYSSELMEMEKSKRSDYSFKSEYSKNNIKVDKHSKKSIGASKKHSIELPMKTGDAKKNSNHTTNVIFENTKPKNFLNKSVDKKIILKSTHNIGNIENEKNKKNYAAENCHANQSSTDCTKNASSEIQRLLENLDLHLQSRMNTREASKYITKHRPFTESNIASFWDNPLQRNDLIGTKNKVSNSNVLKSNATLKRKTMKKNNIINSELQAICKTIEKNIKNETHSTIIQDSSESENGFSDYIKNKDPLRSESLNTKQNIMNSKPIHNLSIMKRSTSNLNLAVETRFPCKYKMSRSFDLNPYDDIIKAHLNPIDRRVKSVAAKNDCTIIIDGPLKCYDPSNTQALRNKVMYRCTIGGSCKDSLDKCFNYLKETFPNTFLKTNSRIG